MERILKYGERHEVLLATKLFLPLALLLVLPLGRSLTTLSLMRLVDDEFRAGVETNLYVFALPD